MKKTLLIFCTALFLIAAVSILVGRLVPKVGQFQERVVHRALGPVLGLGRRVSGTVSGVFGRYVFLTHVSSENESIKKQLADLHLPLLELESFRQENESLRKILNYQKKVKFSFQTAKVIAIDPVFGAKTLLINQGSRQGIQRGRGVITPEGVVGVVDRVTDEAAVVLLMTDPQSAIAVEVHPAGARGILSGKKEDLSLGRDLWITQAEYFGLLEAVHEKDLLVTSGLDQVFPSGIPVGRIRSVTKDSKGFFLVADAIPVIELTQLKEVLVLKP